jgi:hypothetical protein
MAVEGGVAGRRVVRDLGITENSLHNWKKAYLADKENSFPDKVRFAVAAINKKETERLILLKKDNPLDLHYNYKDNILYFCSEQDLMKAALDIRTERKRG